MLMNVLMIYWLFASIGNNEGKAIIQLSRLALVIGRPPDDQQLLSLLIKSELLDEDLFDTCLNFALNI